MNRELERLGFSFEPDLERSLDQELKTGVEVARLSPTESEVMRPIILAKASDVALLSRRSTTVSTLDLRSIRTFCIPFIWPCVRTTILNNPHVSASVLTAGDVRSLEVREITTNEQLVEKETENLAREIANTVEGSIPGFRLSHEDSGVLRQRIELWKIQARLLFGQTRRLRVRPTVGPSA